MSGVFFRVFSACAFALLSGGVAAAGVELRAPELGWVLLAPAGSAELRVLDLSRGAITPLATLRSRGRGPVVAAHLQLEGRLVWVLGERGLDVHDAYNGRVLAHWDGPDGVRLEGLEVPGRGRPVVRAAARRYEAVVGAVFLVPIGTRVSMR